MVKIVITKYGAKKLNIPHDDVECTCTLMELPSGLIKARDIAHPILGRVGSLVVNGKRPSATVVGE